jgi:hypothetical protein
MACRELSNRFNPQDHDNFASLNIEGPVHPPICIGLRRAPSESVTSKGQPL